MKLVSSGTIRLLGEQYDLQTTSTLSPRYLFSATPPMMTDVEELATQQSAGFLLTKRIFNHGQLSCMVPRTYLIGSPNKLH